MRRFLEQYEIYKDDIIDSIPIDEDIPTTSSANILKEKLVNLIERHPDWANEYGTRQNLSQVEYCLSQIWNHYNGIMSRTDMDLIIYGNYIEFILNEFRHALRQDPGSIP